MILSKRMADHKPHDMICELVDNAFDADAKRVWIELGRRSITVGDDGDGHGGHRRRDPLREGDAEIRGGAACSGATGSA